MEGLLSTGPTPSSFQRHVHLKLGLQMDIFCLMVQHVIWLYEKKIVGWPWLMGCVSVSVVTRARGRGRGTQPCDAWAGWNCLWSGEELNVGDLNHPVQWTYMQTSWRKDWKCIGTQRYRDTEYLTLIMWLSISLKKITMIYNKKNRKSFVRLSPFIKCWSLHIH